MYVAFITDIIPLELTTDFQWLITLILRTAAENLPRMLIFLTNTRYLSDAFEWVRYHSKQTIGDHNSISRMYQLTTDPEVKAQNLRDLSKESNAKIVFCSSSLSMGINLARVQYVLHYGAPATAAAFFQETGRAA